MLSKVLNGCEASRARPALFASVNPGHSGRVDPAFGTAELPVAEDLPRAQERIRGLESESAAARREAFEAGRREGEEQARLELGPILERMTASAAELIGMRAEVRRRVEKDAVELSLLIARRVLHRELNVDPGALTALARVVFERLARAESYRIVIHPRFADAIRSALPGNYLSRVQIEADPSMPAGTLMVHSEEGLIDASVDVQLEEITRGLADRLLTS